VAENNYKVEFWILSIFTVVVTGVLIIMLFCLIPLLEENESLRNNHVFNCKDGLETQIKHILNTQCPGSFKSMYIDHDGDISCFQEDCTKDGYCKATIKKIFGD